jgi:putative ABC transport system permease protein
MDSYDISYTSLALCLALVAAAGAATVALRLGLARDMAWSTFRLCAQLAVLALVLKAVFNFRAPWVLAVLLFMVAFAAWTIRGRVKERAVAFFWPLLASMVVTYVALTLLTTAVLVGAHPWWSPRYLIPLAGMIIGNSMNAIAVALDRLFAGLRQRRREVETLLALGATGPEAAQELVRDAVRAGLLPTLSTMLTVGVVSLPGMMTGQILAGADPALAIRYQIMIYLVILVSTATGAMLATLLAARRCFTAAAQLRW